MKEGSLMNIRRIALALTLACAALVTALGTTGSPARAAASLGCQGGDFAITLPGGRVLSGYTGWKVAAGDLPSHGRAHVQGRYVEFDVDLSTFAVYDYALTGASNPLDPTGGVRTPLFASKVPALPGTLDAGDLDVRLFPQGGELRRSGSGLGMKLQLKDCVNGGIFQMESATQVVVTHTLAAGIFYFTNPFTGKINFGNGAALIGKDSPMVATKLSQAPTTSTWRIEAGGRMGMVLGEDAVEAAPPSPACTQQCQVQNQVQGTLPVPGR
jgi:hypothetical protein